MSLKSQILEKIKGSDGMSAIQVATAFSISRAYSNRLLHELQEENAILLVGKTNQAIYLALNNKKSIHRALLNIDSISLRLSNKSLDESAVFQQIERDTGIFLESRDNILKIVRHAFTEMLNNAIDHSCSEKIEISCRKTETSVTFTVRDFGIGIFNNVRDKFQLPGTLEAIQEILKGKTTTAPAEHTGEGVFFTSKMADVFIIDSYEKRLTCNNLLPDIFITNRKVLAGTRVSFSIQLDSKRKIEAVFGEFTDPLDNGANFDRTRVTIKLFQYGQDLPSRSGAKRVTMNLEYFNEVELDFTDVDTVGQGFADEIFRVWQSQHPKISIFATNANENVAFMIKRADGRLV